MFVRDGISKPVRSFRLPGAVALIAFWPTTTSANAIAHPAVFVLPLAWGLLIPIILIEARIAQRILGWDFRRSLSVSVKANFISSLIGIPVSILSPLPILEYHDRVWFFAMLMLPMYLASVLCEFAIVSLSMELYISRRPAWRWALIANGVTYLMILAVLGLWLLLISLTHPHLFEPREDIRFGR